MKYFFIVVALLSCFTVAEAETMHIPKVGEYAWRSEGNPSAASETKNDAMLTAQKDVTGIAHRIEVLSNELKHHSSIIPRRTIQLVHSIVNVRILRNCEREHQQFRRKKEEQLRKISETVSDHLITTYFTLLCRRGYYIYTLRKLLI